MAAWNVMELVRAARRRRCRRAGTFVFADLAGYTALSEERGDQVAAAVAHEFRRTMAALSRLHGARAVQSLGDGMMLWAPDAGRATALAAHTVAEVGARDDLLPVRVGVHTGSAVVRGGNWFGTALHVAARLAAEARPNEVRVSDATREALPWRSGGADVPPPVG